MEENEKLLELIERYRIMVEVFQTYLTEDDLKNAMADIAHRIQNELILGFENNDSESHNN